jgi:predicted O-linked N-acetylglucosamine transferase (SPINDLY family)
VSKLLQAIRVAPEPLFTLHMDLSIAAMEVGDATSSALSVEHRRLAATSARTAQDTFMFVGTSLNLPHIHDSNASMVARLTNLRFALAAVLDAYQGKVLDGRATPMPVGTVPSAGFHTHPLPSFAAQVASATDMLVYQGRGFCALAPQVRLLLGQMCPELYFTAPHLRSSTTFPPHAGKGDGRVRLGILSTHMNVCSTGKAIGPVVALLPTHIFDITVFTPSWMEEDSGTKMFIHDAGHRHVRLEPSGDSARNAIASHQLDVLLFTEVGEDSWAYLLGFGRLARVQVAFWSKLWTSGLSQIDYFVSSETFHLPESQSCFAEQVVQFSSSGTYFVKPPKMEISESPASLRKAFSLPADSHIYMVPHAIHKFSTAFDWVLRQLLEQDPRAFLVLCVYRAKDAGYVEKLKARLAQQTVDLTRVQFMPQMPFDRLVRYYIAADVLLDPFPFGGGITSLDGFMYGVPIVTAPSEMGTISLTASFYRRMGITDLIAANRSDYVRKAIAVAGQSPSRRSDRAGEIVRASEVLYTEMAAVQEWAQFLDTVHGTYVSKELLED